MTQKPPSGPTPSTFYCFGCGQDGHPITRCPEIDALISKGKIIQNEMGKICWPDKGYISRGRDETVVQAIERTVKQSNAVRAQVQDSDTEDVYQYVEVKREDSDADTDDQEELGWSPGPIANCYAGAERNTKVSREARKQVQFYPPSSPQRVEKLSNGGEAIRPRRQNPPISNSNNLHSNHPGNPPRLTPIDPNQNKFEGKVDDEFVPMDLDKDLSKEPGNKTAKAITNQPRSSITKSSNPGTTPEKVSMEIIDEVMNRDITVCLGQVFEISLIVRRSFLDVMRGVCGATRQTPD